MRSPRLALGLYGHHLGDMLVVRTHVPVQPMEEALMLPMVHVIMGVMVMMTVFVSSPSLGSGR